MYDVLMPPGHSHVPGFRSSPAGSLTRLGKLPQSSVVILSLPSVASTSTTNHRLPAKHQS